MLKTITYANKKVEMTVCQLCEIGSGVTRYPDGMFVHAQRQLRDGYCDDCWEFVRRRGNGNGTRNAAASRAASP